MTRRPPKPPPQIDRPLAEALARLRDGTQDDPFSVLGPHDGPQGRTVRVFQPDAVSVRVLVGDDTETLHPVAGVPGAFVGYLPADGSYRIEAENSAGTTWAFDDPYRFGPVLGEIDEYLIGEGTHHRLWDALGAHVMTHEGAEGVHFAVWAPERAARLGRGRLQRLGRAAPPDAAARRHRGVGAVPARHRRGRGLQIRDRRRRRRGPAAEIRPGRLRLPACAGDRLSRAADCAAMAGRTATGWQARAGGNNASSAPISIYEVHLAELETARAGGRPLSYVESWPIS
jgi:1,4-alpha-glucan branching enzyme